MKNIILIYIILFSGITISCDSDRNSEPIDPILSYVGSWSGKIHSDKFCSGNAGTWEFKINSNGKVENAKFKVDNQEFDIIETKLNSNNNYASFTGKYISDYKSYKLSATLQRKGDLAGTWESNLQEDKCWNGKKY